MQCPACDWHNPTNRTLCFACSTALPDGPGESPDDGVFASGSRATFALWLDLLSMVVVGIVVLIVGNLLPPPLGSFWGIAALVLVSLWHPALLDALAGGSLGHRLTGLRVVNARGDGVGFGQSLLRHGVKYPRYFLGPFVLGWVESWAFKGRALQDVVAQTHLVRRSASEDRMRHAVQGHPTGSALGWVIVGVLGAVVALVLGSVAWYAYRDHALAASNPRYKALDALLEEVAPLQKAVKDHYQANGDFALAENWPETLPPGVAGLQLDRATGVLTLDLTGPELAGRHLVLQPEIKASGKVKDAGKPGKLKHWGCRSPDLGVEDLPLSCRMTEPQPQPQPEAKP